ncbi:MAG: heme transporter HemC [Alphaproteobacteria bacterium CG11_big_fil_rev_8_21_14_0_20_44_7]|nr:MAG: heme transporter HemC [Alphaproteobacteria bacterium CG11_big_fil_rev_8_21_14_0_20_44_7]
MFNNFIKVSNIEKFSEKVTPVMYIAGGIALMLGLILAFTTETDPLQGGSIMRIMYVHVPAAWLAMFAYAFMGIFSAGYLIWRNPLNYLIAKSAAPIGAVFAATCLITGSIWGYPTWGTWWVWDARLTSMLILFFMYLGYLGLSGAFHEEEKEAKSSSILAVVGLINLPIIKYSVEWWNTLHQPASVFRVDGPSIHSSMLLPLFLMAIASLCIFLLILSAKLRSEIIERKLSRG